MSVAVVGSIAFDSVRTPFGSAERELGGSAVHAALAASRFTEAQMVGPIGDDFGQAEMDLLSERGIETTGVELFSGERTFAWRGRYDYDLFVAHTEDTELNVFEGWRPKLSAAAREADCIFLASMDPKVQLPVREQWKGAKWSALDSIAFWIHLERDALVEAIGAVDIVLLNDDEARALTDKPVLLEASQEIMSWGPQAVVVKRGPHGCSLLTRDGYYTLPGYPLEQIADPTGAGDAFAGAFMGCLDLFPGAELNEAILRRAVTYGSVVASFCVEEFGARRLARLSEREIEHRVADFREMTHFEHVETKERRREQRRDPTRQRTFEIPEPTAGTQTYAEPEHTGGTRSYDPTSPGKGTPAYDQPSSTPGTQPQRRPKRGPAG
ncbi:MAG: PfkB family carbohydrate kinase [Solirubrobacterales bacterium]